MNAKHFLTALAALAVVSITSCKPEEDFTGPAGDGLLNFTVMIPDQDGEYSATKKGPYEDGETIYIEVPTTYENPVDLTVLEAYASFDNNCHAEPSVPSIIDLSKPYTITVVDGQGNTKTHYIEVRLVYPRVMVKESWRQDNYALQLQYTHGMSMAVNADNIYILDAIQNVGNTIKVYKRSDGTFVEDIVFPEDISYIHQINFDDAGRLVCTRHNMYGAGFRLYLYDLKTKTWEGPVIDYVPAAEGEPVLPGLENGNTELGWRTTLIGDMKQGKAYVYTTTKPGGQEYYMWEFNDGTPVSNNPTVNRYSNAREAWTYAVVRRCSLEADSDHYIAYVNTDGSTYSETSFEQFTTTGDVITMNPANFGMRILDFNTFTVNGEEWLALTYQDSETRYSGTHLAVYDITDREQWSMTPEDPGYNFTFRFFNSSAFGGTNYESLGSVCPYVDGDKAYIYVTSAAKGGNPDEDNVAACLICYELTYTQQAEN